MSNLKSKKGVVKKDKEEENSEFKKLLTEEGFLAIPKPGDVIHGKVILAEKNLVRIDIEGYRTGIVRGPELVDLSGEYSSLKPGTEIEAVVIDIENENGEVELSFRHAGSQRAWEQIRELMNEGKPFKTKIASVNKGGLMARVSGVMAFLPVSQLAPDNYPRVTGGDKQKIYEKLRSFVGNEVTVKIIDVNEEENKLIVSEKAVWEESQRGVIEQYKTGTIIEGKVTALADFGAFVKFEDLEGLVHISEIAWQRIDHPRDMLTVGDTVKAKIIGIEGSKIFLSMKQLIKDPWANVGEKYKIGSLIKGKILKANPFGFFVELDNDIHGLAHISELSDKPVKDVSTIAKPGDELEWRIVSVEPEQHRLGLSLKAAQDPNWKPEEEKKEEKLEEKAE